MGVGQHRGSDIPFWGFELNLPSQGDKQLILRFRRLFSRNPFTLGTEASDKELTLINQQCIHPLLDHTEIPAQLQSQNEDEDEDEEDE